MLTESGATKQLQKLYGKKAGYRINKRAATPQEREAVKQVLPTIKDKADKAKQAMEERRKVLLQDPEYQRLIIEHKATRDELDNAHGTLRSRRITVGKITGMFFQVTGEGDTWEEALEEARSKV